mmetsp:Transcript_88939/g.247080  ORF Transcript_88939/g.247080 Transcript_88939/m.247080 type:complete len:237 (-) Transcript_88939:32-742(-)
MSWLCMAKLAADLGSSSQSSSTARALRSPRVLCGRKSSTRRTAPPTVRNVTAILPVCSRTRHQVSPWKLISSTPEMVATRASPTAVTVPLLSSATGRVTKPLTLASSPSTRILAPRLLTHVPCRTSRVSRGTRSSVSTAADGGSEPEGPAPPRPSSTSVRCWSSRPRVRPPRQKRSSQGRSRSSAATFSLSTAKVSSSFASTMTTVPEIICNATGIVSAVAMVGATLILTRGDRPC